MRFAPYSFLRSRRGVAAVAILVLVLFLFRPAAYHLRNRIATSIGSALGRRVSLDNVRLRLLPRPGFDLEGLVIYDDPAFSAEPMIRAQDVSAPIRLRSLLRGRLEISTLSANEPSINLVLNQQGRWNLASLLERNAQIPAAPTAKSASERRPAFPYLEASNARVNFKRGQTKKSYALVNAEVALWQDSENSWGARIKAEPVRTDFNLTDTGVLLINASWQRASSLRATPFRLSAQWQKGQLGQITKLLSGKDRGWRGGVNFTANLSGTLQALQIESRAAVEDFHRYDIVGAESVRLATGCSGNYSISTNTLSDLLCESPVNGGTLRLQGGLALSTQVPAYNLTLAADKVPLASVVRLLRQAKKQVPSDLTAGGLLNAELHVMRDLPVFEDARHRQPPRWTGSGSATNVRVSSNAGKDEVAFRSIPLTLVAGDSPGALRQAALTVPGRTRTPENDQEPAEPHLRIGPVEVTMNAAEPLNGQSIDTEAVNTQPINVHPVNAGGWISTTGYRFFLRGDVDLKEVFGLENIVGLPVTRPAAEGSARLDVSVSGSWQGFAAPAAMGTAQLRNVRAEIRGLNAPIEISSATVSLAPDAVLMQKISARTGTTHWSGEVTAPRHCTMALSASGLATRGATSNLASGMVPRILATAAPDSASPCMFQFDLTADQLSTGELAEWFLPHPAKRPWYRILNSSSSFDSNSSSNDAPEPPPLLAMQARGMLHVGHLGMKKLVATQVATQLEVDRGKVTLTALRAQLLQGAHQGNWIIDASNDSASNRDLSGHELSSPGARDSTVRDASNQRVRYHGSGVLQGISLAQVGALMNDDWISGTADGKFDVQASGDSFRDLLAHSDGKLQFVMRNGSLQHVEIPGAPAPLPVYRFAGELHLKTNVWELSAGRLESRDGFYQVSGVVSAESGCDFAITRGDEQSWKVTGTLAELRVTPGSRTVAKRTDTNGKTVKP